MRLRILSLIAVFAVFAIVNGANAGDKKIRVLIIDGQNNHAWAATTPVMKKALEGSGKFTVDVATSPAQLRPPGAPKKPKEETPDNVAKYKAELEKFRLKSLEYKAAIKPYLESMEKFQPDISKYDVVLSNYNGDMWSSKLKADLDNQLKAGKIGLVIVHAANNSFGSWNEFRHMVGMGWYGANTGDRLVLDEKGQRSITPKGKGDGPGHRYTGPFSVTIRDAEHPITKGMPLEWLHERDELYDNMRGPIENVHLLATAYSYKDKKGTGQHEPMIWTVSYGKGRVFHTPLGHDANAMTCVGFQTTLQRGTEWAATGAVTIPIPSNFPTAKKTSVVPK